MSNLFKTPVLLILFNRPVHTQKLLKSIEKVRPENIYISIDGPRDEKDGLLIKKIKKILSTKISWKCKIKFKINKKNKGCRAAVSEAITWFFENVDEGIILEDDIIPNESFFYFTQKMLKKYRNNNKISMITGTNYQIETEINESYFFSRNFTIWGWATWKRMWNNYDSEMSEWNDIDIRNKIRKLLDKDLLYLNQSFAFNRFLKIKDHWDVPWVFSCLKNNTLCITPSVNLISNIGFLGSHTERYYEGIHNLKTINLDFNRIVHPSKTEPLKIYDEYLYKKYLLKSVLINIISNFLKKINLYSFVRKIYYYYLKLKKR
jgi:hypothetical protein